MDNLDGTVTDTCTGLMWQKDTADVSGNGSNGDWADRVAWQDALKYCENVSFAGHDDWRLPNVRELQSIVDYGRHKPACDPIFQDDPSLGWGVQYWSSSFCYINWPGRYWCVDFINGGVFHWEDWNPGYYVRAVRNAP